MAERPRRIIIAITGATGATYGVQLLRRLHGAPGVETHLVVSDAASLTLHQELGLQRRDAEALAHVVHRNRDVGASIASGSYQADGMVIAPCSMKTLAAVAHGFSDNLVTRAADVILKERRRLVLMVRETPFNLAHLRNMTAVTEMGGIVFPPLPSFYHRPATIADMVEHTVDRVVDLLGIENAQAARWGGMKGEQDA
ncbi:UbiX family flavin prenyltransferase [Massilia timonae]|uniref:Flavin prenyltransferase UbiX n=1 Tax=Massilia timonae CCUG 45783 TaxID=883126 RepID=K9DG89_9BURK|nr:UbiX family flavin prenyltransferase [Massilia timonae]EKU83749.1 polyprenyl P-hydroxybenzoate and phenylacrylic acid decarboxylase [Massilia timonae CCUG 45783]